MTEIQSCLFSMKDEKYRDFHSSLMPTVSKEKIIGVRTPLLRKYAAQLYKSGDFSSFINTLPHEYYEEYNLHAILINKTKDFDECINQLDRLLPFVDNWANCDIITPPSLKKNPDALLMKIKQWLASEHTYTVRYGVKCLMDNFLGESFSEDILHLVKNVNHDDYYVKMVQSWFFATALAKQYDKTLPLIENKAMPLWIHNKTIQKAVESYRITSGQKEYLKTLRVKQ